VGDGHESSLNSGTSLSDRLKNGQHRVSICGGFVWSLALFGGVL
jgi:hypothetical protein